MTGSGQDQTLMIPSTSNMHIIAENQKLKEENAMLKNRIIELEKTIPSRRSKRLRLESVESDDEN